MNEKEQREAEIKILAKEIQELTKAVATQSTLELESTLSYLQHSVDLYEAIRDELMNRNESRKFNAVCWMCKTPLDEDNRAKREDESFRNDMQGHPWCQSCTDKHDSVDFG